MSYYTYSKAPKLIDCEKTGRGSGSELIIVEGDSAQDSVSKLRDRNWQAVLPVQGKPLNSWKASRNKVEENLQYEAIISSLGIDIGEDCVIENCKYDRVVLMLDPDADGILIKALLIIFFYKWLKPLVGNEMLFSALPPLWEFSSADCPEPVPVYTQKQYDMVLSQFEANGITNPKIERFRGLGNFDPERLQDLCLNPETRVLNNISIAECETIIEMLTRSA